MSQSKPVEAEKRILSGFDFFVLWAGAAIALTEIWAGGLITRQGLVWGLIAIVLGHLIGCAAMAATGLIGSRHGVPSIVSTRAALGKRGAHLAGLLNVMQLLGWTGFMIWVGGQAASTLPGIPALGTHGWMILIGVLTTLWALGGPNLWKPIQRLGVLMLFALSVFMTWRVLHAYDIGDLISKPRDPTAPFLLGLDAVIVMPVSWLPLVADYARYAKSDRSSFQGTFWGFFLGSCWMYAVGLVAALATGSSTPDAMVIQLLADSGWISSALFIILLSTFTTTFLDIYSTTVSAQSILPRLPERATTIAGGLIGTLLALFFDATSYEPFLLFIGAAFCPLFGIVLADYFIVKRQQFAETEGVNVPALVAWVIGFALYHASVKFGWPVGASLPSMFAAALLHLIFSKLARKSNG